MICVLCWYCITSAIAFVMFGLDKSAAIEGQRRIPERCLLGWSIAGGWFGAFLGQRLFHHKTRKSEFQSKFWLTVLINSLLLGAIFKISFMF